MNKQAAAGIKAVLEQKVNVDLTEVQMGRLVRRNQIGMELNLLREELKQLNDADKAEGIEYLQHPISKFLDNVLFATEQGIQKLMDKVAVPAALQILGGSIKAVLGLSEVTRHTVRLYNLEGKHLSDKTGEQSRLTWYSNPQLAIEISEHIITTGKMVYVDLTLDFCSNYSFRFYKQGYEAFILQGDLIKASKRNWKYVKSFRLTEAITEVATAEETN